jgi:hypothetical protein
MTTTHREADDEGDRGDGPGYGNGGMKLLDRPEPQAR